MKIFKLSTLYSKYISYFEDKLLSDDKLNYHEIVNLLASDYFNYPKALAKSLKPLGYEVVEYIFNYKRIQDLWAKTNNINIIDKKWAYQIALEQIKHENPEILYIYDHMILENNPNFIKEVREQVKSIKLVLVWCSIDLHKTSMLNGADAVLTCSDDLCEEFRRNGLNAFVIHHAFDPDIVAKLKPKTQYEKTTTFIGSVIRQKNLHLEREEYLEYLAAHIPMEIYTPKPKWGLTEELKLIAKQSIFFSSKALKYAPLGKKLLQSSNRIQNITSSEHHPIKPINKKLSSYFKDPVFGIDMYQKLKESYITFNIHIGAAKTSSCNMRMFEATGAGTCLLTDSKQKLPSIFTPGKEVVVYENKEDCIEKVKWLIDHPDERDQIANRGQQKTLDQHTIYDRSELLNKIIKQSIR